MNMHEVQIFVPSTINVNQAYDSSYETNQTALTLSAIFGGAFHEDINGLYRANNGEIVLETIHRVTSFADSTKLARHKGIVFGIARNLARKLGQESVLVKIDNQVHFITQ